MKPNTMIYENGRRKLVIGQTYTIYKNNGIIHGEYKGLHKHNNTMHMFSTKYGDTYVLKSQLKSLNLFS